MAVKKSCEACRNLQEYAPEFVLNGVTENVENSLKNNTGFNPASGRNDCQDLNDANDCLVGNMEDEVDAYEVCEWKEFMPDFIHNLWSVLKSIISAICGIWKITEKNDCEIKNLYNGATFTFSEDSQGSSKVVPGKGVDFSLRRASGSHSTDITLRYIAGGLLMVFGSLKTFTASFYDASQTQRSGNSVWDFTSSDNIKSIDGGELLYEIRIKKSEYPQIKQIFNGKLTETTGIRYACRFIVFNAGSYAYGQHGWCEDDGSPSESGYSSGHLVPDGWIYCQARLLNQDGLSVHGLTDGRGNTVQGSNFSPAGYTGIRMNRDGMGCDDDGGDDDDQGDD